MDLEKGTFISSVSPYPEEEYYLSKSTWSATASDWDQRFEVGDVVADPSGSWTPGTAEAYIDQQVGILNTNLTSEVIARQNGDSNLQTQLQSEMNTRADQDANLNALINAGIREGGGVQFDIVPTQNSANGITSGGMYSTLRDSNIGFVDDVPIVNSGNLVKSGGIYAEIIKKENALTDDNNFNKLVKELYVEGVNISAITRIDIYHGCVTGENFFNAMYVFTSEGNFNVFQDVYATQQECIDNSIGFYYSGNNIALVDISSLETEHNYSYSGFNFLKNIADLRDNPQCFIFKNSLMKFEQNFTSSEKSRMRQNIEAAATQDINNLWATGYMLAGGASPSETTPQVPVFKQMKIAIDPGTYPAYNNLKVYSGELAIFYYINDSWGKAHIGTFAKGLTNNSAINAVIKELYLPGINIEDITRIRVIYAQPTGNNYYNALFFWTVQGGNNVIQNVYSSIDECTAHAAGVQGNTYNDYMALVDFSQIGVGESYEEENPKIYHPLTLDFCPSIKAYKNSNVLSAVSVLTTNDRFNQLVKELYLGGIDISTLTKIAIHYVRVTGNRYYNAMYVYTTNGNYNIFQDVYNTQQECIDNSSKLVWDFTSNFGAVIDLSSLNANTVLEFTNLTFVKPLSLSLMPSLHNYHANDSMMKDKEFIKTFFSNVICIGDSVTEGNIYDSPNHTGVVKRLSYPSVLAKLTGWTIENAGWSGIKTDEFWNGRYEEVNFAKYNYANYELAFVAFGYNGGLSDTLVNDTFDGEEWQSNTSYSVGKKVMYNNIGRKCTQAHTSGSSFDSTKWENCYNEYADTQTGSYCKIIEGMLLQNPKLIISLIICSNFDDTRISVVKQIGERYSLCVIDCTEELYVNLKNRKFHGIGNGGNIDYTHFNAFGYAAMANIVLSDFFNYLMYYTDIVTKNISYS